MSQKAIPKLADGSKARAVRAVVVGAAAVVVIALSFLFLDPRAPTGVATLQDALAAAPNDAPVADPPTAYVIDLNTGEMITLPLAILSSLGPGGPDNSRSENHDRQHQARTAVDTRLRPMDPGLPTWGLATMEACKSLSLASTGRASAR